MMRTALRAHAVKKPELESLISIIRKNIGLVFVLPGSTMVEVRKLILANKVWSVMRDTRVGSSIQIPILTSLSLSLSLSLSVACSAGCNQFQVEAQAKAGAIAPCDVIIQAGATGLEPTQTAFLQALNIATRIQKGQIEIINDFHLIHEGQKVGNSEATLLQKLNLKPFHYGLSVIHAYESGFVYNPKALEVTDEEIIERFSLGVQFLSAISLETGYATFASVPHSLTNGYTSLVAIALETDYIFKQAAPIRARFDNPEAFAAAAPAAAAPVEAAAPAKAEKAAEPESSEDDMGPGGMFGDDDW
jgi:hypothetical protein